MDGINIKAQIFMGMLIKPFTLKVLGLYDPVGRCFKVKREKHHMSDCVLLKLSRATLNKRQERLRICAVNKP